MTVRLYNIPDCMTVYIENDYYVDSGWMKYGGLSDSVRVQIAV